MLKFPLQSIFWHPHHTETSQQNGAKIHQNMAIAVFVLTSEPSTFDAAYLRKPKFYTELSREKTRKRIQHRETRKRHLKNKSYQKLDVKYEKQ